MRAAASRLRGGWRLPLAISLLLTLPYVIAIHGFFYTDDWVHLCGNASIPPWAIWRYFSPQVIWFYRPFQALQFGWLYHAFGLRPAAYNLSLWAMHLMVCTLVYRLASRLVSRRTALLTTALFAPQWLCANSLLWRSNFSTLHGALATIALCLLFLCYLDSGRRAALFAAYGLLVLDLLAKETAVNAPLLLGALWVWHRQQSDRNSGSREWFDEGASLLAPFVALVALYLAFHHFCVRDVYRGYVGPYYRFASPWQAVQQTLFSFNYALLSFSHDPFFLPRAPWLRATFQAGLRYPLILPMALTAVAGWRRDRTMALGCCWIFLTLIPTAWLDTYRMDRFFYLPMVGVSLLMAYGLESWWQAGRGNALPLRALRVAPPLVFSYLTAVNLISIGSLCLQARADSVRLASAFQALRASAGQVPPGTLVILRHAPAEYFAGGLGVNEMVRVSLGDPQAVGINEGQPLSPRWASRVKQLPSVYWLDFGRCPPVLEPSLQAARRREPSRGRTPRRLSASWASEPGLEWVDPTHGAFSEALHHELSSVVFRGRRRAPILRAQARPTDRAIDPIR